MRLEDIEMGKAYWWEHPESRSGKAGFPTIAVVMGFIVVRHLGGPDGEAVMPWVIWPELSMAAQFALPEYLHDLPEDLTRTGVERWLET